MTVTILTLCGLCSALTACSSNDDTPETDNNPLATQLNGCWWSQHDVGGTVTVDGGTTKTYAKKLQVCRFGADGKAEWMKLLLDKDGGIVKAYGAITTYDEDGKVLNEMPDILHYTSTADGAITMQMQTASALPGLPNSWQLKYQNGIISGTDDGTAYELTPATAQMEKILTLYSREVWLAENDADLSGANGDYDALLAPDLAGVKYEIIRDTAMWKFDILSNVYSAMTLDHDIAAELEKMRNEAEKPLDLTKRSARSAGMTRSTYDPKVAWIPSGFRYVDYTYESVDEQGNPVTLSSRVCWGVMMGVGSYYFEFRPCDLVLCAHSTIADDLQAPTKDGSIETLLLQGDRVLILPDYLGFGASKDRVHPYINHDLCARHCIDALKAGYKVFSDRCGFPLHPDWKFYLIGDSQGGANMLATQKWIDTHGDFAERWRFQYSYCAVGPYSPRITFEKYFEQKVLDYPVVLPLTLKAMLAAYPDILGKWKEDDFYSETYLQHKSDIDLMISSKEFSANTINSVIFQMFPHTGETGIKPGEQIYMTDIVNPEVCDMNSEKCKALFQCFERNDLTKGWTPTHPIHLYHDKGDTYVSYANSEAVVEAFPDKATLKEPDHVYADHIKTCVFWMLSVAFGLW